MADTIPNLWLDAELKTTVLTPIAILRTQATLLGQKTQNLLMGNVRVTVDADGQLYLSFTIIAPAVNNYRFELLSVEHKKDASYPATVYAQIFMTSAMVHSMLHSNGSGGKTAYSDKEFIAIVQEVLQAPETIARLQSLIIRSNEEMADPLEIGQEIAEQSEEQ